MNIQERQKALGWEETGIGIVGVEAAVVTKISPENIFTLFDNPASLKWYLEAASQASVSTSVALLAFGIGSAALITDGIRRLRR